MLSADACLAAWEADTLQEILKPRVGPQWIEDRFWIWIHYGAGKIGRRELFEAHDMLTFLRAQVLGPLMLQTVGARPTGVRRVEKAAPGWAREMEATVAKYEPRSTALALREAAQIYRALRGAASASATNLRSTCRRGGP